MERFLKEIFHGKSTGFVVSFSMIHGHSYGNLSICSSKLKKVIIFLKFSTNFKIFRKPYTKCSKIAKVFCLETSWKKFHGSLKMFMIELSRIIFKLTLISRKPSIYHPQTGKKFKKTNFKSFFFGKIDRKFPRFCMIFPGKRKINILIWKTSAFYFNFYVNYGSLWVLSATSTTATSDESFLLWVDKNIRSKNVSTQQSIRLKNKRLIQSFTLWIVHLLQ